MRNLKVLYREAPNLRVNCVTEHKERIKGLILLASINSLSSQGQGVITIAQVGLMLSFDLFAPGTPELQ
jgi:hypothetical protein